MKKYNNNNLLITSELFGSKASCFNERPCKKRI